eukprot:scaffold8006_cov113-Isochrysis_galbana.AAC.8
MAYSTITRPTAGFPAHRRIPLIDYTAVCLCLIVCPLVIFKDPSRHLRSWRSCALSARARTAPNGRMDSVSHGSGGIDPPPEYRSSYSRLPVLLSPAPSKHQLQEYRSTVLQVAPPRTHHYLDNDDLVLNLKQHNTTHTPLSLS